MTFFQRVKLAFQSVFSGAFGQSILLVVVGMVQQVGKSVIDDLIVQAKDKVVEVEGKYPSGSGGLKRKEALDYLKDSAAGMGLNIAASLLALVLEVAVSALKAEGKI